MQMIIDIPDEDIGAIKYLQKNGFASRHELTILNGTPLPKNATNGDMINALFPNAKEITVDGGYPLNYIIEGEWHRNLKEWWDKPYKTFAENIIRFTPSIIEADKESDE